MNYMTVGTNEECLVLESGAFKIAVTTKVGPRVIGGYINGSDNIFVVLPPERLEEITTDFMLYGGHRIWHAPEANPRTYAPDNDPVEVTELDGGAVCFSSGVEELTGIEKSITIRPLGEEKFELTHKLTNRNEWPIELAPWALSQMAPGGTAVIPQHRDLEANRFAVDRSVHFWPYSSMNDHRLTFTREHILLKQDAAMEDPIKIGYLAVDGWIAYALNGVALVKHIPYNPEATYPDYGCNVESYTNHQFLEIETLAPLAIMQPGQTFDHIEVWHGLSGVGAVSDDASIASELRSRL